MTFNRSENIDMIIAEQDTTIPWFKQPYLMLILALLATSIAVGILLLVLAINNPPRLTTDDYYDVGKGINQSLEKENNAKILNMIANISVNNIDKEIKVMLAGQSKPEALNIRFASFVNAKEDIVLTVPQVDTGVYLVKIDTKITGKRFIDLRADNWRLTQEQIIGDDDIFTLVSVSTK